MRKDEYLSILSERLRVLPAEEYNDIMEYYKEYFEDAGSENEEAVVRELGDVELLAQKIISENMPSGPSQNGAYVNGNAFYPQGGQPYVPYQQQEQGTKNGMSTKALIAILTFPLWIGIVAGLFGVILGFGIASIACLVAGIVCIITGCVLIGSSVATCILFVGAGFIVIAVGLGFAMATFSISHLVTKLCRKIFGNKQSVEVEKKHL